MFSPPKTPSSPNIEVGKGQEHVRSAVAGTGWGYMRGDIVISPSGEEIVLVDVGQVVLYDDPLVRVWEVALEPGETHSWHLHHNPYVVLSVEDRKSVV
jgi:hypothetical protein